jgi:uncharacterized protein YecE (DUF72 family)
VDFGKLPDVSGVDFTLPPDPPDNAYVLANLPARSHPPRMYLGATGYSMKAWVGKWYPSGSKDKDFLRHYGRQFNTLEHNTTHYRMPDAAAVRRWREETPADFRFCPKIPQTISHSRDLGLTSGQIPLFAEAMTALGDRLGCCFMQFPPSFSLKQLPLLERFVLQWPAHLPLAFEMRHPSFFEPGAVRYYDMLQSAGLFAVITDVAGRRDVCHMRVTGVKTLVRFVGNAPHPSDHNRIRDWALRLKRWFDGGLHEAYVFTHQPDNLLAPELAAFAEKAFREAVPEAVLRGPKETGADVQGRLF